MDKTGPSSPTKRSFVGTIFQNWGKKHVLEIFVGLGGKKRGFLLYFSKLQTTFWEVY